MIKFCIILLWTSVFAVNEWIETSLETLENVLEQERSDLQKLFPDELDLGFVREGKMQEGDEPEDPLKLRVSITRNKKTTDAKNLILDTESHLLIKEGRTRCFQSRPHRVTALAIGARYTSKASIRMLVGCKCGRYDADEIQLVCPDPKRLHSIVLDTYPDMSKWVPSDGDEQDENAWTGILWVHPLPETVRNWSYPITTSEILDVPQTTALAQTLNFVYVETSETLTSTSTTTTSYVTSSLAPATEATISTETTMSTEATVNTEATTSHATYISSSEAVSTSLLYHVAPFDYDESEPTISDNYPYGWVEYLQGIDDDEEPSERPPDRPFTATRPTGFHDPDPFEPLKTLDENEEEDTTQNTHTVKLLPARENQTSSDYPASAVWPGEDVEEAPLFPTHNSEGNLPEGREASAISAAKVHQIIQGPIEQTIETSAQVDKDSENVVVVNDKPKRKPGQSGLITAVVHTDNDNAEIVVVENDLLVEESGESTEWVEIVYKTSTTTLKPVVLKVSEVDSVGEQIESDEPRVMAPVNAPPKPGAQAQEKVVVSDDVVAAAISELEKLESTEMPKAKKDELHSYFPPTAAPAVAESQKTLNALLLGLLAQREDLTLAQKVQILSLVMSNDNPPAQNGVHAVRIVERG